MLSESDVRTALGVDATIGTEQLNAMIGQAMALIETRTRRYFRPVAAYTDIRTGDGTYFLRLSDIPRSTITSVAEQQHPGSPVTTVTSSQFTVRNLEGMTILVRTDNIVWHWGWEYTVVYDRGYTSATGPKDIDKVMLDLVALQVSQQAGAADLQSETLEGVYSYSKPSTAVSATSLDTIPGVAEILKSWERKIYA